MGPTGAPPLAAPLVPDDPGAIVEPPLPPEPPKPQDGRPRLPNRAALTALIVVVRFGVPGAEVPPGTGLRLRHHLLAAVARLAACRGVGPAPPVPARPAGRTGPDPTDRARPGTNHHLNTDRQGAPRAVRLSGAIRQSHVVFDQPLDLVPGILTPVGRRRRWPPRLHADNAYDCRTCRRALRRRHIRGRIARTGIRRRAQRRALT